MEAEKSMNKWQELAWQTKKDGSRADTGQAAEAGGFVVGGARFLQQRFGKCVIWKLKTEGLVSLA